jgi:hypothetical protein
MLSKRSVYLLLCGCMALLGSCAPARKALDVPSAPTELADHTQGWLRYKVYRQPAAADRHHRDRALKLSIRVINMEDNSSPLRRLCGDLQDYNTYYEYLLNGAKNEIYLEGKKGIKYPVFYAFENNYNAFPFETFNLGYTFSGREKLEDYNLVFIDRVFAKDTIVFSLNNLKK